MFSGGSQSIKGQTTWQLLRGKTADQAKQNVQEKLKEEDILRGSDVSSTVFQLLDEERIATSLSKAVEHPGGEISDETVTALFEALSFHTLLDDAAVNAAVEQALLGLSEHHDLALAEGGRYPGLYRLLAHDNQKLRLLVSLSSDHKVAILTLPIFHFRNNPIILSRIPWTTDDKYNSTRQAVIARMPWITCPCL